MKKQGSIVRWDRDRGFGFIRSTATSPDIFFHIKDFRGPAGMLPQEGQAVTFEEIHVGGKGPRAMAVQLVGAAAAARPKQQARRPATEKRGASRPGSGALVALPLMLAYAAALAWAVWTARLPFWVLPASAILNLLAFFAYWQDKFAAGKGAWRIKEDTLHLWSIAGGWAGAWFAQQLLRHKSSKPSFLAAYWGTVVLHCGALAGWLWWTAQP